MFSDDARLLAGAPRLFGIVADADTDDVDVDGTDGSDTGSPTTRGHQHQYQPPLIPDDDDPPPGGAHVVAWGHELPDQAVLTWRLDNGGCEIAVFSSAEAALATAQLLYPARLLWTQPAQLAPAHPTQHDQDIGSAYREAPAREVRTERGAAPTTTPRTGAWYQ